MQPLRILALLTALLLGALPAARAEAGARRDPPAGSAADARQARAQLETVRAQIARISRQVSRGQAEQDRLTRQLRATEQSVGVAQAVLEGLRQQRQASAARRIALMAEKRAREADLTHDRSALAGQLRAAYLIGREEPLKLLLSQGDPARAGRMFAYYSYFGRARALEIQAVEADLERIGKLDGRLQAEDAQLQSLQAQQQAQVSALEQARSHRIQVLASIAAETHTRAQRLALLRRQQSGLEALLEQLRRVTASLPREDFGHSPFSRLRGRLPWPVSGRIVERYGEIRAGGLKWQGDLFATRRDAPVRAISQGRVIYADWLAGLGLLIIIDHGDGYMSLYGHNDRLYESVGQRVGAGETIAVAGDSGGGSRPELYFEIRKGGRPVDPGLWLAR